MNGEEILNAINYLDDDLIEATAKLRSRRRKPYWLAAAAAACLCLLLLPSNKGSMAPMESNKADGLYTGLTDEMKQESYVESPMESQQFHTSVLCINEVGEDFLRGTVQNTDASDLAAELLTVSCDPEVAQSLKIGDIVRVTYIIGEEYRLLELQRLENGE